FTHLLGSQLPIPDSVFNSNELWLQVEVEGQTIGTRSRLTAAAVSKRVANVDGAIAGNVQGALQVTPGAVPSSFTIVGAGNDSIIIAPDDSLSIIGTDPDGNMTLSISTKKGLVAISMFDPVDSKDGSRVAPKKRVEIRPEGIVLFDSTGTDTSISMSAEDELTVTGTINGSTPWTTFPFAVGYEDLEDFSPSSRQRCQYRKVGDIVYVRGTIHKVDNGVIPSGTTLGTLPVGFRPPGLIGFSTHYGEIIIGPTGLIDSYNAGQPWQYLDVISFSTTP
ncbi:MAG: hypothetical protein ACREBV_06525, partial [Candidatus Zixiibacteriota bacterium]